MLCALASRLRVYLMAVVLLLLLLLLLLQILAVASRETKDAMRLVHVPSFRTFPNWPTSQTPLKYVNDIAFSPNGGYIASGNDKGQVLLYSLTHYTAS